MSEGSGRVEITPTGIRLGAQRRLLFGGEVQYYRLRDEQNDPTRTHEIWAQTLDRMSNAGMNLVTTYVPWDYHELEPDRFRWDGVADLERFLELCGERDLAVVVKPGPFINSEWPTGIGSFGAVPTWFKEQEPDALSQRPDGSLFSSALPPTSLLRRPRDGQPSIFSPSFLRATRNWFSALAPRLLRFVKSGLVFGLQIDNETNFFFGDRYGVDYCPAALEHYRDVLAERYQRIELLNAAYETTFESFDQVEPPLSAPARRDAPWGNLRHQDWLSAGQEGIERFQLRLRGMWEDLGFREPDLIYFTNDSPHTLHFLGLNISQWHGRSKNQAGLAALDAYPKMVPVSGRPLDVPFLTAYFSKRFAASNRHYRFAGEPVGGGKCYGMELQGGLFELPGMGRTHIPVASTDHVLLQHLGRGSAMAAVYVLRAGRNLDGSPYFQNAALDLDGRATPRWEALVRYGHLVRQHGDALLESQPVESSVAVAVDSRFDAPAGGVGLHPARAQVDEAAAMFGLCELAGFDPAVIDLADGPDLSRYRLVILLNPDAVHTRVAQDLCDYVQGGGHLLNLFHLGRHDETWRENSALIDGLFAPGGPLVFRRARRRRPVVLDLPDTPPGGVIPTSPYVGSFRPTEPVTVLARLKPRLGLEQGPVVGWTAPVGQGQVTCFSASPAAGCATSRYYREPDDVLERARGLLAWLAGRAGARPAVRCETPGASCWARRLPRGGGFVFVASRRKAASEVTVELLDPEAVLGSGPGPWRVTDALSKQVLLRAIDDPRRVVVPLGPYGTAVLRFGRER